MFKDFYKDIKAKSILYNMFSCCSSNLNVIEYDDTIPFVPEFSKCKVIKVYDGDTITVAAYLKGQKQCYRFSVRLRGIDSPEIKTHNDGEKLAAIKSRDSLSGKILNEIIYLENIVKSLQKQGHPEYDDEILKEEIEDNELGIISDGEQDSLFRDSLEIIKKEGKASTSLLQRKLQIGYNRAARIIDQLEEQGFISAANHVGKREINFEKFNIYSRVMLYYYSVSSWPQSVTAL